MAVDKIKGNDVGLQWLMAYIEQGLNLHPGFVLDVLFAISVDNKSLYYGAKVYT